MRFKQYLHEISIIKLGGAKDTKYIDNFLKDYEAETKENALNPKVRIWQDSVGFELSKFGKGIHISSITNFAKKGTGKASAALTWLCALADKHHVTLELIVEPIGHDDGNLNKNQLKAWYKRNNFMNMGNDKMVRSPEQFI